MFSKLPITTRILLATLLLWILAGCGGKPDPNSTVTLASDSGPSHSTGGSSIPQGTESSAGGGNAVVCFVDNATAYQVHKDGDWIADQYIEKIKSIEMLDLYIAHEPNGFSGDTAPELMVPHPEESPEKFLERVGRRFQMGFPIFDHLIKNAQVLFSRGGIHQALHGIRKINDLDSDEVPPENCVIATVAAQRETGTLNGHMPASGAQRDGGLLPLIDVPPPELLIDPRLYNHPNHGVLSRATLLLHEYLYLWTRSFGQTTSRLVRQTIALMLQKNGLTSIKVREFVKFNWPISEEVTPIGTFKSGVESILESTAARAWLAMLPTYVQNETPEDLALFSEITAAARELGENLSCDQFRQCVDLARQFNGKGDWKKNELLDRASVASNQALARILPELKTETERAFDGLKIYSPRIGEQEILRWKQVFLDRAPEDFFQTQGHDSPKFLPQPAPGTTPPEQSPNDMTRWAHRMVQLVSPNIQIPSDDIQAIESHRRSNNDLMRPDIFDWLFVNDEIVKVTLENGLECYLGKGDALIQLSLVNPGLYPYRVADSHPGHCSIDSTVMISTELRRAWADALNGHAN